jgi:hypothetical protein
MLNSSQGESRDEPRQVEHLGGGSGSGSRSSSKQQQGDDNCTVIFLDINDYVDES